jgi:hypothetical protein
MFRSCCIFSDSCHSNAQNERLLDGTKTLNNQLQGQALAGQNVVLTVRRVHAANGGPETT